MTFILCPSLQYPSVSVSAYIHLYHYLTGSYGGERAGAGILEGVEFLALLSDAVTDEVLCGAVSEEEDGVLCHVGHERRNGPGVKTAQT